MGRDKGKKPAEIRCPHALQEKSLVLCDAGLELQVYDTQHRTKDRSRFIVTDWWCLHTCKVGKP